MRSIVRGAKLSSIRTGLPGLWATITMAELASDSSKWLYTRLKPRVSHQSAKVENVCCREQFLYSHPRLRRTEDSAVAVARSICTLRALHIFFGPFFHLSLNSYMKVGGSGRGRGRKMPRPPWAAPAKLSWSLIRCLISPNTGHQR